MLLLLCFCVLFNSLLHRFVGEGKRSVSAFCSYIKCFWSILSFFNQIVNYQVLMMVFPGRIEWYVKTLVKETTTSSMLCLPEPPRNIKVREPVQSMQFRGRI